jgi:hypothetical protein
MKEKRSMVRDLLLFGKWLVQRAAERDSALRGNKTLKSRQAKQCNLHPGVLQDHLGRLAVFPRACLSRSKGAEDKGKCQCQEYWWGGGSHIDDVKGLVMTLWWVFIFKNGVDGVEKEDSYSPQTGTACGGLLYPHDDDCDGWKTIWRDLGKIWIIDQFLQTFISCQQPFKSLVLNNDERVGVLEDQFAVKSRS